RPGELLATEPGDRAQFPPQHLGVLGEVHDVIMTSLLTSVKCSLTSFRRQAPSHAPSIDIIMASRSSTCGTRDRLPHSAGNWTSAGRWAWQTAFAGCQAHRPGPFQSRAATSSAIWA